MFCHKCGTHIDDGQMFCHKCGTKVVYDGGKTSDSTPSEVGSPDDNGGILRRCPACHAINNGYAKICSECGADMDNLKTDTKAPAEEIKPYHQNEAPEEEPKSDYLHDTYSGNINQPATYTPPIHIYEDEPKSEIIPEPAHAYSPPQPKTSGFKAWCQDLTELKKRLSSSALSQLLLSYWRFSVPLCSKPD